MLYLGSERTVTQDYATHKTAEDYAGDFKSIVKISGRGKVIKVVNKFISHEDSINYNTFLQNQKVWYINGVYHCISITGKKVLMGEDELGGNQIWIETYENNIKLLFRICHLDKVVVNVGDIVDASTTLGYQGNTGLVLSGKSVSDITYGTHVHLEITNNGVFINPRKYATGEIITSYKDGSNAVDESKNQIKILVNQINIRKSADVKSADIGDVYYNEYYDVLDILKTEIYTWYKIETSYHVTGYVANLNGENWLSYIPKKEDVKPLKLIYTCEKSGKYLIELYKGEKLYIETV